MYLGKVSLRLFPSTGTLDALATNHIHGAQSVFDGSLSAVECVSFFDHNAFGPQLLHIANVPVRK